jgi:hypothetical protein
MNGARFDVNDEIQKAMTDQLNKIPVEDFSNATKKFETRVNICNTYNGSYFELIIRKKYIRLLFFSFYCLSPGTFGPHCVSHFAKKICVRDTNHLLRKPCRRHTFASCSVSFAVITGKTFLPEGYRHCGCYLCGEYSEDACVSKVKQMDVF